jgi:hypothetical protein
MAQGVRMSFLELPQEGDRVVFYGQISAIPIIYNNGLNTIDFEFTNNDAEILADPLHRVKIGANIEITANNLKAFLDSNGYQSSSIPIYNSVVFSGTIWNVNSFYTTNSVIIFDITSYSDRIGITAFNDSPVPTLSPKYFFQYENVAGNLYKCEIYQVNFTGTTTEINGRATINKGEAKDHFDTVRGTGLSLRLEASESLNFEDLYTQNERDLTVRLYADNVVIFQGFIKPDGIYQSFVNNVWDINVECVDGLGFLSDLSFVKNNGVPFTGKMSALDIIYNCLNRTGLQLKIMTFIDVYFYGIVDENIETDVLKHMHLDVGRFIKSDDSTTMSCAEVLTSILELFNGVITQERGQWYIYRPSSFYANQLPFFKRYKIDNTYIGLVQENLKRKLGSDIDNYYPHHCNANQKIEIKGAISAFRLGYKYGFVSSLLGNGKLEHAAGTAIYEGWDVQTWTEAPNTGYLVIDPVATTGINFKSAVFVPGTPVSRKIALISNFVLTATEGYSFDFKTRFISHGFPASIIFTVSVGSYFLNQLDGSWGTGSSAHFIKLYNANVDEWPNGDGTLVDQKFERAFTMSSQPLPDGVSGNVQITMEVPVKGSNGPDPVLVEVKSIELTNTFQGNNIVGEFHTVSRINPVSSIVRENKTTSIGDSPSNFYTGAIYMANGLDLTKFWHRGRYPEPTSTEVKPILRISAEDELRISARPTKIFSGDFYGKTSYLGVYEINNVPGKFMPVSYSFDTFNNIGSIRLLELYYPELFDIDYTKTDDYGETVKPTITG